MKNQIHLYEYRQYSISNTTPHALALRALICLSLKASFDSDGCFFKANNIKAKNNATKKIKKQNTFADASVLDKMLKAFSKLKLLSLGLEEKPSLNRSIDERSQTTALAL